MGPIVLFDKSFLQSLTVDEAVWLDHFFCCNICPVFFVEALADLEKAVAAGQTPEQVVGALALKSPQVSGYPNLFHSTICLGELSGAMVPMTGQILLPPGRTVQRGERTGVVIPESQEAVALSRWQRRSFLEAERLVAKDWRARMRVFDLAAIGKAVAAAAPPSHRVHDLASAKQAADEFVSSPERLKVKLALAAVLVGIPLPVCAAALKRWQDAGPPPLTVAAPYTAFVLSVLLFFYYATEKGLIARERVSNIIDISYLFYLPFTTFFTSTDKLHRRCAPLFMHKNQQFLWGAEFKRGLAALDAHYDRLPEETKRQGISEFASRPPKDGDFLVARLWDFGGGKWRTAPSPKKEMSSEQQAQIVQQLNEWTSAPEVTEGLNALPEPSMHILRRNVDKKRGKWYQVPADMK